MEDNFKFEIVSPEKIIFSNDVAMVTLPSYEGDMSVLKYHISIITFLRPGIVRVQKNNVNFKEFFVQDGTIEYFKDCLTLLSTSVINIKDMSKELVDNLSKDTKKKLENKYITDHDRYMLNHKIGTLKEITI